jgi:hypothetical protein
VSTPYIQTRPGHPDFLDLDWSVPIDDWRNGRTVDLPTGVHRHPVRFVAYGERLYAIKELPLRIAHHEYDMLRALRRRMPSSVRPVGIVERRWLDPTVEGAGVVITRYVEHAFSYRELIEGGGFGRRRNQMLDAFAGLLVELHLAGCFWGDCSLSNVLYRYDAGAIQAIMIDGETVELHDELTPGQRHHDLDIMILNVAGGMADIAAQQGVEIDDADLALGVDIAARYASLWDELEGDWFIRPDERYLIRQRVDRLNELGFDISDLEIVPADDGTESVRVRVTVAGRTYHSNRLRELTSIEASENQARQILSDLYYHETKTNGTSRTGKSVAAIRWRVDVFEPLLGRIVDDLPAAADPVQAYCDFLHHRYLRSEEQARDVANDEAYASWAAAGFPGLEPA